MSRDQAVALPLSTADEAARAAQFIAELVRQGVTFRAQRVPAGPHEAPGSAPALSIEFTGGY